jgi:cytochrome P450 family 307 subfamily A
VQKYGPVVGLRLGLMRCAVVQNDELIREVLITKADHFDSRPNFVRFHAIFGGSKKNGESSAANSGSTYLAEDFLKII